MTEIIGLALLVWVPVLLYGISRRSFVVVLIWLFIAPLAMNVVDRLGGATVVDSGAGEGGKSGGGRYSTSQARIQAAELLNPTRLLYAGLLLMFMVGAALKRRRMARFDSTEKFAFTFSLILVASALFRANRTGFALRIAADAFIIPFVAYLCARRLVTSEERLQQVMKVIGYMGFYIILLCALERLIYGTGLYYRVGGPFNDPNVVHVVMSITFLIGLVDLLRGWLGDTKLFNGLIRNCFLFAAPVIDLLTWARATWLAFLCSITLFLFLNRRFLPRSVKMLAAGVAFTMIPLILVSFFSAGLDRILQERVTQRTGTVFSRIGAWDIALHAYSSAPMLGIGLMNLRETLYTTRIVVAQGVRSEANPHNSFITILAEQGPFGLIAYLGILISIFQMGRRVHREHRLYGSLIIAIMISYLVPALFTNLLHGPRLHALYVYALMGAIAGVYGRHAYTLGVP